MNNGKRKKDIALKQKQVTLPETGLNLVVLKTDKRKQERLCDLNTQKSVPIMFENPKIEMVSSISNLEAQKVKSGCGYIQRSY